MVRTRGKMQDIKWRNPHGMKVDFAMKNKYSESKKNQTASCFITFEGLLPL